MASSHPRLSRNNFDLLRLVFALTVCLIHSWELSGFRQLAMIPRVLSSEVAVRGFFVVSGFLIFMSYERSKGIFPYFARRARRIYPAYATVVLLCAFGLAVVSAGSLRDYFGLEWLRYVVSNLAFLNFFQLTLPGVFEHNRIGIVNGALWTLKIEVMFYLAVPLIALLCRRLSTVKVLAGVYGASVLYAFGMGAWAEASGSRLLAELSWQLPGQLSYFMSGAFFYYFLDAFERRAGLWLVLAAATLFLNRFYPLFFLEPLALATVVIFFGLFGYLGPFGRYGDFSYGVYILHFPIIQLVLGGGWFDGRPWPFLATVAVLTAAGAVAMWHLVEKRFLHRTSHYVREVARPESLGKGNPPGADAFAAVAASKTAG